MSCRTALGLTSVVTTVRFFLFFCIFHNLHAPIVNRATCYQVGKPISLNKLVNYEHVRKKKKQFSPNFECVQIVGGGTNKNSLPHESKSNLLPHESKSNLLPHESKSNLLPHESKSNLLPHESKSNLLPHESRSNFLPHESKSNLLPHESKSNLLPHESRSNFLPHESRSNFLPHESRSNFLPHDSKSNLLPHESRSNLSILITSPEGAKIYRFVVLLLIYRLSNIVSSKDFHFSDNSYLKNNTIVKILNLPIVSIGKACNDILNNDCSKTDFTDMYQILSIENTNFKINHKIFCKINKNIGKLNIVFTPSKANAETLKKEFINHLFNKQKGEIINAKKKIIWIASAISQTNFNDSCSNTKGNSLNKIQKVKKSLTILRINCYDTKKVTYNKRKNQIRKKSIICLMSNSTVVSYFENFGNHFSHVVCMGKNSYMMAKKLNFKNVHYPEDSKIKSFLNMLINLYNKLRDKYDTHYDIVLTREKHKNEKLAKALTKEGIPYRIVPCIKTQYHKKNIQLLYSIISSHM
ncbi:hypothetical protein, conserved [Plasmodium gonderi]|uniref:Uroporphyrinogen-III synthase n=1 Tax=Plasmodium gonderi TaxID=77519 RepID=A0A1Y1JMY5_PLAGO|nr:hypothetical protein, conserved [Plasmodium gonderi]GAW83839.1 hypothetical protein, conserved [Plasmodium gonderi]